MYIWMYMVTDTIIQDSPPYARKNVLFYTARCKSDCFNVEILICGDYAVAVPFKMPSNNTGMD